MKHLVYDFSGQSGSRKDFLLSYLKKDLIFRDRSIFGKYRSFFYLAYDFAYLVLYERSVIILLHGNRVAALVFAIVTLVLRKHVFIYDLGYPVVDIPRVRGFRKFLFSISDHVSSMTFDHILLESEFQKNRFLERYSKNTKFHVFYAVSFRKENTKYFLEKSSTNCLDFIEQSSYILFRGKYNSEAALEHFLGLYMNCSIVFKQSYKLVIQGLNCSSKVGDLVDPQNVCFVKFIDLFLPQEDLNRLIKNASFMVGQFGCETEFPRLRYTIPHKFIEAIEFCVPYLSPPRPVLSSLCENIFIPISVGQSLEEVVVNFDRTCNVNQRFSIDALISENINVINSII